MVDGVGGSIGACNLSRVIHAYENAGGPSREIEGCIGTRGTPEKAVLDARGIRKHARDLARGINGSRSGGGGSGGVQVCDRPGSASQEAVPGAGGIHPYADSLAG